MVCVRLLYVSNFIIMLPLGDWYDDPIFRKPVIDFFVFEIYSFCRDYPRFYTT